MYNSLLALEWAAGFQWMYCMKPVCCMWSSVWNKFAYFSLCTLNGEVAVETEDETYNPSTRWDYSLSLYHYGKLAGLILSLMSHFMLHMVSWETEGKILRRKKNVILQKSIGLLRVSLVKKYKKKHLIRKYNEPVNVIWAAVYEHVSVSWH